MSEEPECETCQTLQVMKTSAQEEFDMSRYTDAVVLLTRHLEDDHPDTANSPAKAVR